MRISSDVNVRTSMKHVYVAHAVEYMRDASKRDTIYRGVD